MALVITTSAKLSTIPQEISHAQEADKRINFEFQFILKPVFQFILICEGEILGQIMKLAAIKLSFWIQVEDWVGVCVWGIGEPGGWGVWWVWKLKAFLRCVSMLVAIYPGCWRWSGSCWLGWYGGWP